MARVDDLKLELKAVRDEIALARSAQAVSVGGHALTRQNIQALERREADLARAVRRGLGGSQLRGDSITWG